MNAVRRLVVALTAVLAGCYRPAPQEGAPCSTLGDCPSPLRCDRGTCRAEPGDAGGTDDTSPPGDAPAVDAPDVAPGVCTNPPSGTWSAGVVIPGLSTASVLDGTPEMRSDLLELFYKSERNGTLDIWRSTRTATGSTFTGPVYIAELSSNFQDGSPALSPDGLTIYISSNRAGTIGFHDIWKSTRASLTASWSTPVRVAELSSVAEDEGLTILPSDRVAYFHSNRSGSYRLYRTTRGSPAEPWGPPAEITELPSGEYENPWVSADDCRIYMQAYRNGTGGAGDIYLASRATPTGAWGAPVKIMPPSNADFDADPWLTPDERIMLYATGGATTTTLDLHIANR